MREETEVGLMYQQSASSHVFLKNINWVRISYSECGFLQNVPPSNHDEFLEKKRYSVVFGFDYQLHVKFSL